MSLSYYWTNKCYKIQTNICSKYFKLLHFCFTVVETMIMITGMLNLRKSCSSCLSKPETIGSLNLKIFHKYQSRETLTQTIPSFPMMLHLWEPWWWFHCRLMWLCHLTAWICEKLSISYLTDKNSNLTAEDLEHNRNSF